MLSLTLSCEKLKISKGQRIFALSNRKTEKYQRRRNSTMKKSMFLLSLMLLISTIAFSQHPSRWINVDSENLRIAPKGQKIGSLLKGTELTVLAEKEKWVKVQLTGWIWKESLSLKRPPRPGEIQALYIMVNSEEKANEVLAALKAGQDFKELARKFSQAPNANKGGDLGFFLPDDFTPAFAKALKKLKVGELSEIIKAAQGYHIFKRVK